MLDKNDPTKVTCFSILIEGDDAPVKAPDEIHQPDNIESTAHSLLIQEDPGSSQQFPVGSDVPGSPNFDPSGDDGADLAVRPRDRHEARRREGQPVRRREAASTRTRTPTRGILGAWESSGIVDASSVFGPGAFLVDVQAGTLRDRRRGRAWKGPNTLTYQRDGGQLGLLRIPGA